MEAASQILSPRSAFPIPDQSFTNYPARPFIFVGPNCLVTCREYGSHVRLRTLSLFVTGKDTNNFSNPA